MIFVILLSHRVEMRVITTSIGVLSACLFHGLLEMEHLELYNGINSLQSAYRMERATSMVDVFFSPNTSSSSETGNVGRREDCLLRCNN